MNNEPTEEEGLVRIEQSAISVDRSVMDGSFLALDEAFTPEEQWEDDDSKITHLSAASRFGQNVLHWYVGIQANRARGEHYPTSVPTTLEELAEYRDMSESAISKAAQITEFYSFQDYREIAMLPRRVLYRATQLDDYDGAIQVLREWTRPYVEKEIDQTDMMNELDEMMGIGDDTKSEETTSDDDSDEDIDDAAGTFEETSQDVIIFLQEFRAEVQRSNQGKGEGPSERVMDTVKKTCDNLKMELEQTIKRMP